MKAVILFRAGEAMLRRLKAATAQFDDTPRLRAAANAIDAARELIEQAAAIDMPTASYVGLQLYVSAYDNEMDLSRTPA